MLATNRLDGRAYAIKKIRMSAQNPQLNHKILREVATLSRLQHTHVVRYFQVTHTLRSPLYGIGVVRSALSIGRPYRTARYKVSLAAVQGT